MKNQGEKQVEKQVEKKEETWGFTLSWIFGLLWIFGGVGLLLDKPPLTGIVYILAGIIFLPPVNKFTEDKFNFKIPIVVKIAFLGLILLAT